MRNAAQKALTSASKDVRNLHASQLSSISSSAMALSRTTMFREEHDLTLMTLGHPAGTNVLENNRTLSLGLRSLKPPDSVSPSNARSEKSSRPEHERQDGLSDAEWEIRTGQPVVSSSTPYRAYVFGRVTLTREDIARTAGDSSRNI